MTPSWRKPAGMFLILALITVWAGLIVGLSATIAEWPTLVQFAFYALTGVIWIMPLKPLLRWMETGKWRE